MFPVQFPITAIREIKILKKLHHDNVINLKEIVTSPGIRYLCLLRFYVVSVTRSSFLHLILSFTYQLIRDGFAGPEKDEQGRPGK